MHVVRKNSRALADLVAAIVIGLLLLMLNVSINYIGSIHNFFSMYRGFLATDWLINFLFFWLALLLWVAYRRWREAAGRSEDMESIISSISPDTLMLVERDRTITMCNASVKRIFGYTTEEVLSKQTDLLYFDRRSNKDLQPREIYEALERDGFHIGLATGKRKNGQTFPLEIISAEVSGRGGAVLLLRDLTERAQAEEKRHELETRIQRRQKMESLGVLAGGVAHDFNNLLTVILGNSELALMQLKAEPKARESIEAAIKAGRQAAALCNQMMAYSGKGKLVARTLDLSEVVRDTVKMLEISVGKRAAIDYRWMPICPRSRATSFKFSRSP